MKIISLFSTPPQHQRFSYRPLYYDVKKDETKQRKERLRREIEAQSSDITEKTDYRTRIVGSFKGARKRSKPTAQKSTVVMRFGMLLFMTLLLMAMFQWGKNALYAGFLVVPFYLYLKFKDLRKS